MKLAPVPWWISEWQIKELKKTKTAMMRTMNVHICYHSWYISFPSSAKQQHEMTKFWVVWKMCTMIQGYFFQFLFQIYWHVLDWVLWLHCTLTALEEPSKWLKGTTRFVLLDHFLINVVLGVTIMVSPLSSLDVVRYLSAGLTSTSVLLNI